ncbi:MAG TPA: plastocyanin/azurin family copper-binding protein [Vicinamibacterales bacterium]|nr:plastocyanin/azurin family copper-binding protein [Vicinamibacterales bacterium]
MSKRLLAMTAAVLWTAACGQSSTPTTTSPSATGNSTVSIVAGSHTLTTNAYAPNPITISQGMSVTWTNNDSIAHTSTANGGQWDSGTLAPGASFSKTFSSAGTFQYHCAIHPNMVGTVTVQ